MGTAVPSGTITFLFTDIEGSTSLWEAAPEPMRLALERHDSILRSAIDGHNGYVFSTGGDGFAAAFARASDALQAAFDAQAALADEAWPNSAHLRVRMGLHTGEVEEREGDYFGPAVNRAARLMAAAHGRQVVCSDATASLAGGATVLTDLGEHRLRDLSAPQRVFQVGADPFPALRSLEAFPTNLPAQSSAFVGREVQLAEVITSLKTSRLVTLTGVGGVGKTRLALQVAADALPSYPDGGWLVDLSGAADHRAIEEAVAATLGIARQSGQSVRETVLSFPSNKRLLIVLDNCEYVLEEGALLVGEALRRGPHVSILATSREALRVDGEQVVAVPSLGLPDESAPLDLLAGADAVRLFVDRARGARTGFTLSSDNADAVVQLCRRLDGIPLAIELAAARVRSMAPGEIAARLDQRFRLLTGGSRTAASRHQTLRRAFDWSYDLLTDNERTLLGRLSVCAGGFDLAGAEWIGSGETIDAFDVDDLICRLVEKSLVNATDAGDATRYRMLETVREYAFERLEDRGETAAVRNRHAQHYADFAGEAGAGLKGQDEHEWLVRVETELDNLRAAVTWSLESEDAEAALNIISALALQGLRIEGSVSSWATMAVSSEEAARHGPFQCHSPCSVGGGSTKGGPMRRLGSSTRPWLLWTGKNHRQRLPAESFLPSREAR